MLTRSVGLLRQTWRDRELFDHARERTRVGAGKSERVRKLSGRKAGILPAEEPAEAILHVVRNGFVPLVRDGNRIADRDRPAVEKGAEKPALVHDVVERDEMQHLAAWLAVEGEANARLADLDHAAGWQVVEAVDVDDDVLAQIARLEAEFAGHRA